MHLHRWVHTRALWRPVHLPSASPPSPPPPHLPLCCFILNGFISTILLAPSLEWGPQSGWGKGKVGQPQKDLYSLGLAALPEQSPKDRDRQPLSRPRARIRQGKELLASLAGVPIPPLKPEKSGRHILPPLPPILHTPMGHPLPGCELQETSLSLPPLPPILGLPWGLEWKQQVMVLPPCAQGQVTRAQEAEENYVIKRELAVARQQCSSAAEDLQKAQSTIRQLQEQQVPGGDGAASALCPSGHRWTLLTLWKGEGDRRPHGFPPLSHLTVASSLRSRGHPEVEWQAPAGHLHIATQLASMVRNTEAP